MIIPEIDDPVVNSGDTVPDQETSRESVQKTDQASGERHRVTDEKLAEKSKVRPHHLAALEHQPVGSDENDKSENCSGDQTLNRRIQPHDARQDDLLE